MSWRHSTTKRSSRCNASPTGWRVPMPGAVPPPTGSDRFGPMAIRRRAALDADSFEQRLLALLTADSAQQVLVDGAALFGDLAGSPIAVALRVDSAAGPC